MPTRDQLTEERLDALLELLVAEGIITQYEADKIRRTDKFNEAGELVKGLKSRRE